METTQRLSKYLIYEELGRGGFGTVYRATDTTLDRVVALKILDPVLTRDPAFLERFHREARAASRLRHPNLVPVYEVAEAEGRHFIAMEYLPGRSLDKLLAEEGRLLADRALHILGQAAAALDYAHAKGLIHRDVKPSNIIVGPDEASGDPEHATLTDFGLVRATDQTSVSTLGQSLGTPAYMSPEQLDVDRQEEVGPASDIYSFAVVAYEMLAGRPPFTGPTPAVMAAHLTKDPPPLARFAPDIPDRVWQVLRPALSKGVAERTGLAAELVKQLQAAYAPSKPVPPPPRVGQAHQKVAPPQRVLRLDAAWGSHPGIARGYNEDTILGPSLGDPPAPPRGSLYLVADGMGGRNAGEVASEGAARRIYEGYYADADPNIHRCLDKVFRLANAELYVQAQANPAQHGMATTLTAVVIQGDRAHIAYVGNSRLYRVRGGKAEQLTQDHSWVAEQVRAGLLSPDQAEVHPQRSVITRALATAPDVKVDYSDANLQVGDVLVLCSDGLSAEVGDNQIAALSSKAASAQEAVQRLIQLANDNGGEDNISVAVIRVTGEASGVMPAVVLEGVTEKVPVVAARSPRRGFPWLFVVVAVTVLLLPGYYILTHPRLPQAPTGPTTPADLMTPAGPDATVTLAPALQRTVDVTPGVQAGSPVDTPIAPALASGGPTVAPTETLAPVPSSSIVNPQSSVENRVTPTSPGPTKAEPTPAPQLVAAPVLGDPVPGAVESGPAVRFSWSSSGHALRAGEGYALFVWPVKDGVCEGWACSTVFSACDKQIPYTETTATILPSNALAGFPGGGEYYWAVMIVDTTRPDAGGAGRCLLVSDRSSPHRFTYTPPVQAPAQ
jgi:serine/threonine protein kinase